MFIIKKQLPRRTVLRGLGATLALPLLDGMVPALTAQSRTAAAPIRRAAWFYVPNGMAMGYWLPKTEGRLTDMPLILEPLAAHRDQVLVLSGLADMTAYPRPTDPACDHARAAGTYLTGVHAKPVPINPETAVSADQYAAQVVGKETELTSLELGVDVDTTTGCTIGIGYSCVYRNSVSWRTPTMALPAMRDARAVFERMFGIADSTDAASRLARLKRNASLLDSVTAEVHQLNRDLGSTDRAKLSDYLDSVRDVEQRIQKAEQQSGREIPEVDKPASTPTDFAEHARLLGDLMVLAFQTDLTRVSTFMLAKEVSERAYPEAGVPDSHHTLSHHLNQQANIDRLAMLNQYHMMQFAYVVDKLRAIPEGDGTLLDRTLLCYGAGISDSNAHLHDDLPIVLVGGSEAGIRGGRHIRYPAETPVTNLWLTMLDKMGVHPETIGDSTGKIEHLSGV